MPKGFSPFLARLIAENREPTALERQFTIPLSDVELMTSVDRDSLVRTYPHFVVNLSPKRRGMQLGHALEIVRGGV
jgi:hypothetical protein